ncbi:MAG TPA: methyltransferase domain-containing protein, partial [Pyrinomonadaceae bacterium]|nr:methyltransferase domain-containing protein [Pyrinomonadaceae bacterium]
NSRFSSRVELSLPCSLLWLSSRTPKINLFKNINRRARRRRRRKQVGKAYDMALEVARVLVEGMRVLDVGCGNGFIAHHLTALLGTKVVGIDVERATCARINYLCYDGERFPLPDDSFDAVLLCYVLHQAQNLRAVLAEVCRVLRAGGLIVVYEDIPGNLWDRFMCLTHDLMWRGRTGRCSFRQECEWQMLFASFDFEIISERPLSRWRNLAYTVRHRFYILKSQGAKPLARPHTHYRRAARVALQASNAQEEVEAEKPVMV